MKNSKIELIQTSTKSCDPLNVRVNYLNLSEKDSAISM